VECLWGVEGGVSDIDPIARAGAKAKGKRPQYFEDPAVERMLSILMAVAGEVAVLRERLDTVERLLAAKGTISRSDIERYVPDRAAGQERGLLHKDYIARIMRGVQQDMEALAEKGPSVEELSRELRDM
jgi:polyhydroxyalkanoate synthesis regulator phasin